MKEYRKDGREITDNMAINLDETRAKFRVIQKSLDSDFSQSLSVGGLTDILGKFTQYCCVDDSFENWYSEHAGNVALFNEILAMNGISRLTEGELKTLYEHTRENIEKNLAEDRMRKEGRYL